MKKTDYLSIFLTIPAIIIVLGVGLGFYYSSLPQHHPQDSKQNCESVGGDWVDDQNKCLLSYKKEGETCTDGGQCISGICFPPELTEEQKLAIMNKPLTNIVGTCYPNEFASGCVEQILMGTVSKESMCMP
ncbi:hypothetical protein ACFL3T_03490 [Patescibacteria group bacterium]